MPSLGRTIKTLRVAAGIRQGDFATQVGVTQAYLSAIESDKRKPSLEMVERVAAALNVPPGALLAATAANAVLPQYAEVAQKLQELQQLLLVLQVTGHAQNET